MIETNLPKEAPSRQSVPSSLLHDLRTPLNQILGYSEMLIEQAQQSGNDEAIPDLRKLHAAGDMLLGVIEQRFDPIRPTELQDLADTDCIELDNRPVTESESPDQPDRAQSATSPLLLVVDDIEANRDVLARRLLREGYDVRTADNGRVGLEMLNEGAFDLVLLDVMMPELDGYEVLGRMKADDRLRHIPVIMISAINEFSAVGRCIEMGAEDYLSKPFNPILLKSRIAASLAKKNAHDREMRLFEELAQNFERLKEVEEMRDGLTHLIIHDLRTPLSSVIAGMQTLGVVGDLNADQREVKDIAVFGGETLLRLINDVLDVEKSESAEMELKLTMVSASDLVGSAIGQVAALAESRDLRLVPVYELGVPLLRCDESKLIRTLVNLLGNALKFTKAGGNVVVCTQLTEDRQSVMFSVCDNGEGIPPEAFDRIFEKFGQVESRAGGHTMSTGLGLTFCKLAAEAHGGNIGVKSTPGEGSTFWFTIPLPA